MSQLKRPAGHTATEPKKARIPMQAIAAAAKPLAAVPAAVAATNAIFTNPSNVNPDEVDMSVLQEVAAVATAEVMKSRAQSAQKLFLTLKEATGSRASTDRLSSHQLVTLAGHNTAKTQFKYASDLDTKAFIQRLSQPDNLTYTVAVAADLKLSALSSEFTHWSKISKMKPPPFSGDVKKQYGQGMYFIDSDNMTISTAGLMTFPPMVIKKGSNILKPVRPIFENQPSKNATLKIALGSISPVHADKLSSETAEAVKNAAIIVANNINVAHMAWCDQNGAHFAQGDGARVIGLVNANSATITSITVFSRPSQFGVPEPYMLARQWATFRSTWNEIFSHPDHYGVDMVKASAMTPDQIKLAKLSLFLDDSAGDMTEYARVATAPAFGGKLVVPIPENHADVRVGTDYLCPFIVRWIDARTNTEISREGLQALQTLIDKSDASGVLPLVTLKGKVEVHTEKMVGITAKEIIVWGVVKTDLCAAAGRPEMVEDFTSVYTDVVSAIECVKQSSQYLCDDASRDTLALPDANALPPPPCSPAPAPSPPPTTTAAATQDPTVSDPDDF